MQNSSLVDLYFPAMSFSILRRFINTAASNAKPIVLRRFLNTTASNSNSNELRRFLNTAASNSKPTVLRRFLNTTASNSKPNDSRRFIVPEELPKSVMLLSCESSADGGVCNVYVVGTVHVSSESCSEVKAVISKVKPEVVFLELCSSAAEILSPHKKPRVEIFSPELPVQVPTVTETIGMWNLLDIVLGLYLLRVANRLGVVAGYEFRVAYEEARKYGGRVILGDRPVEITSRRTWGKMPLWHKIKILSTYLFKIVFLPSREELKKMIKVGSRTLDMFPTVVETLLHERDQYMSSALLTIASKQSSVVAVVGRKHLQGIKKHWKQPVVVQDLMVIP